MRLHFSLTARSVKGRYLVHAIGRFGERYIGVVWRRYDHCWQNSHDARNYTTRKAAARGLMR